ncbi:uncharacterized protein LOC123005114 [Tribolium madens]|uniref:uncharacterized protein LOC123005114 n=1 Tax=Tribolium madens TaxID=41895 RepID=UPI001CF72228|nr:uncharacterized protein LOC123005114 [Tribolium madens]
MQVLVVLAVCVLGAHAALDPKFLEKLTEEVQAVGTACGEKEHATADDMIEIMEHKFPPTHHEAKCVIACYYKHYKMMKDDGTFDKDAAIKAFDEIKSQDADIYGKILKVIDACDAKKQMSDDHCESAASMAACVKKEAESVGLTKEAFMLLILVGIIFFTGSLAVDQDFVEKFMQKMEKIGEVCAKETHATTDDVTDLIEQKDPKTHEGKCLIFCYHKKFNTMKEDGSLDKVGSVLALDDLRNADFELYKQLLAVFVTCGDKAKIFDDPCETATALTLCGRDEAKALGLQDSMFG